MMDLWLEPPYYWLLAGLLLMILEALLPGTFCMWLGFAALGVSAVLFFAPELTWQTQLVLYAVFAAVTVGVVMVFFRKPAGQDGAALLNRRGQQYVGRTFSLETPISNGQGRLRIDDSSWKIIGEDCPAGTRVQVVGFEGIALRVEPAPEPQSRSSLA